MKVLTCRLDNIGDVLLAGPAVRAVASAAASVTFLAGPNGAAAAEMLPGVDDVIRYRAPWIDPGVDTVDRAETMRLVESIRSREVTHALVFSSFHQCPLPLALLLRMAEVGTIAAVSEEFPGALLDVRHRVEPDMHEVERALSLAATLGFRLPFGDDGRLRVRDEFPGWEPPRRYVVVHPGSTAPARTGSPDQFAAAVDALLAEGWGVVVTGSASERPLTAVVAGSGGVDAGGTTTLPQLAGLLRGASAVVTGNTGAAHLAAAVDTPVVQLFPPTVPLQAWRPWGVRHVILGNQAIACAGCRSGSCPLPGHPCVETVAAEEVVDAVRCVLSDRDYRFGTTAVLRRSE